jgi:hypothetical protein
MDFAVPETAPTIFPFITGESEMLWARLLAYGSGTVKLRNEYLAAVVSGRREIVMLYER